MILYDTCWVQFLQEVHFLNCYFHGVHAGETDPLVCFGIEA